MKLHLPYEMWQEQRLLLDFKNNSEQHLVCPLKVPEKNVTSFPIKLLGNSLKDD